MSGFLGSVPGGWEWLGPMALAFVVACAGAWLARRDDRSSSAVAAAAALAGWAIAAPRPGAWMAPRMVAEALVLPAAAVLLAVGLGARVRARVRGWLLVAATWFGAWWLAGVPAARDEFWRVLFATVAMAWVLRLVRANAPGRAAVVGLVLLGGSLAVGAAPAMAGVLAGAAAGLALLGGAAPFSPALLAFGVVGIDLAAGRARLGRLGLMDVACGLAVLAPLALGPVEASLRRRVGRLAPCLAVVVVAACAVGLAWIVMRVLR